MDKRLSSYALFSIILCPVTANEIAKDHPANV